MYEGIENMSRYGGPSLNNRAITWGFYLYVGSFLTWLLAGQAAGWRMGAQLGSTVALLGVALIFFGLLFARHGLGAFIFSIMLASFPLGILAWSQGAHGYTGLWTTVWVFGVGLALSLLLRFRAWLDRATSEVG